MKKFHPSRFTFQGQGHWNRNRLVGHYDLLLLFHNNYGPILHHFRDKWRYLHKFPNPRVFNDPAEGVFLENL